MGKISNQQDERLLGYIDGTLSPEDQKTVEQEIAASTELKARLEELRQVTAQLAAIKLEHPSRNFTQRVMSKLEQYPLHSGFSTRNGIFLLAGVMVAVGLASLLLAAGVFDSTGNIDLNQIGLQSKYINQELPSIPFNGKLIVNVIILANIALAFLVLDRAVLRPWFEKRTRMHY